MREPDPNLITNQIRGTVVDKKSDVSMIDRNSLFSKSSQLSREMLVSKLLLMNKNYDSGQSKQLQ